MKALKDKKYSEHEKTQWILERFEIFVRHIKYKVTPRCIICVLKAEGDILLELRDLESAMQIYK
jgi:hypothetical protein